MRFECVEVSELELRCLITQSEEQKLKNNQEN